MLDTPNKAIQVGLIGSGIQLSRSPALHEAEGRANGLALTYELIDLDVRGVGLAALPALLREV
ncbi:MAG: shikimate dehydrogenase, partial [Hyphomicrobiales bacterium]